MTWADVYTAIAEGLRDPRIEIRLLAAWLIGKLLPGSPDLATLAAAMVGAPNEIETKTDETLTKTLARGRDALANAYSDLPAQHGLRFIHDPYEPRPIRTVERTDTHDYSVSPEGRRFPRW